MSPLFFSLHIFSQGSTFSGYIYADNYFELFYNGEFLVVRHLDLEILDNFAAQNDPVDFIPHNAVFFNITEEEEPECR